MKTMNYQACDIAQKFEEVELKDAYNAHDRWKMGHVQWKHLFNAHETVPCAQYASSEKSCFGFHIFIVQEIILECLNQP